jgi:enoyl-CoA hydratase/carnithine racemase
MSTVNLSYPNPHTAIITLDDQAQLNAMSEKMADDFTATVDSIRPKADSLRAIILTGAGKAFSAGGDLQMLLGKTKLSAEENRQRMLKFYNSFLCILELQVPVIAAINGAAIGAGLCVACAADIRIASNNAKFGFTFTKLGLHPGMGATFFVPKVTSPSVASQLLLTGRIIDANEAFRVGLISEVTEPNTLIDSANKIVEELTNTGKESVRQLLLGLRDAPKTLAEALTRESNNQAINYAGSEFLEGVTATIEKRKAKFI